MKYFIKYSGFHKSTATSEITAEAAKDSYKQWAGSGFFNLKAIPEFRKGTKIKTMNFTVWGETVSGAECFKRRLNKELSSKILEDYQI